MKETGTEYLQGLLREAENSPLLLLLESTTVFVIALLLLVEIYIGQDGYPLIRHIGYYGVAYLVLCWVAVSTAVYILVYRAYLQHYLRVLSDQPIVLNLLARGDARDTGSFKKLAQSFLRSYHSQPATVRLGANPAPWRWAALMAVATAVVSILAFAIALLTSITSLSQQQYIDANRLMLYLFAFATSLIVWLVLDRPRHFALRAALAMSLLRQVEE